MNSRILNSQEMEQTIPGEAISLAAVMAILAIAIVAVVVYRIFRTSQGSAKMPGGWQFTWK
jgi:biopolymer transport protein ExbB/TolQ